MIEKMYSAKETAEILGVTEKSLATMRYKNTGPEFLKLGPRMIRYRESDLQAFINEGVQNDKS